MPVRFFATKPKVILLRDIHVNIDRIHTRNGLVITAVGLIRSPIPTLETPAIPAIGGRHARPAKIQSGIVQSRLVGTATGLRMQLFRNSAPCRVRLDITALWATKGVNRVARNLLPVTMQREHAPNFQSPALPQLPLGAYRVETSFGPSPRRSPLCRDGRVTNPSEPWAGYPRPHCRPSFQTHS